MGHSDGFNSVLYYSMDTHKILSSWNFCFFTQTTTPPAADDIKLDPAPEGEKGEKIPVKITDELNENRNHKTEET